MSGKHAGQADAPALPFLPATFRECGVSVPFTTPPLVGARIRIGSGGHLEAIVPSPSGRGAYVLLWAQIRSLCQPTLFDLQLMSRLASLPNVDPAAVRGMVWQTAAEGLAGRPAIRVAEAGLAATAIATRQALAFLHRKLLAEPGTAQDARYASRPSTPDEAGAGAEAEAVDAFALRHGLPPEAVAVALRELATLLADFGLSGAASGPAAGRFAQRVVRLESLRDALRHDAGLVPLPRHDTGRIVVLIDLLLDNVAGAMHEAAGAIAMPDLVRGWMKSPEPLRAILSQPDWLLDGWDRLDASYRLLGMGRTMPMAVSRLAALLPPLPAYEPRTAGMFKARQIIRQEHRHDGSAEDTRTERSVHDQVARGEAVIAMLS